MHTVVKLQNNLCKAAKQPCQLNSRQKVHIQPTHNALKGPHGQPVVPGSHNRVQSVTEYTSEPATVFYPSIERL